MFPQRKHPRSYGNTAQGLYGVALYNNVLSERSPVQKTAGNKDNDHTEVYMLLIEENPFEKGLFLKLLS